MDEEEINYMFLRKIEQTEKNSPKLSKIDNEFYEKVSEHIHNLEKRYESEENTQKKKILQEEIVNLKKIFLNIYEHREKKILLASMSKARGGKPLIENMTENENNFFSSILENISKFREKNLSNKNTNQEKKDENTKSHEEDEDSKKKIKNKPIVRIKEDIPNFIGTDKQRYNLKKNDVLSISSDMCDMISKRKVCEKIEL